MALYHVLTPGSNAVLARLSVTRYISLESKGNSDQREAMPKVWILQSPHSGDNTQLRALAGALGWPAEVKRLVYRRHEGILRLFGRATLAGVDIARSSPLDAPWPDLVICSGRGAEAVAFWLQRQNPKLRIVFIGTPWSALERFDLIVTTPQYRLPQAPNVLHNALPLHDVTAEKLQTEARRWEARLQHLPRPYTAVLVGGSSGPYLFSPESAARLGRAATDLAKAQGGSLLVTTSARTKAAAVDALEAAIGVPHHLYRWQGPVADNPFHAFLGLSEQVVVTADSVSMLAEATATGRPVYLFDIEHGPYAMRAEEGGAPGTLPPIGWKGRTLATTLFRLLINHLPPRFSRDLRVVHRQMHASGRAAWLGEGAGVPTPAATPQDGLARAVARIRALFGL
jgi:mitochondrial fission protein ELM1